MSTLLEIITDPSEGAAVLCGLPNPSTIVGSTEPNVPLLLRLSNQEGRSLVTRHDWQVLKTAYTVTSLGAELQTALPADFDHMVPNGKIWNRTTGQVYNGPTDDNSMEALAAIGITAGAAGWWELRGGSLYITPAPTAGQTLAFRYISKNWVDPASGSNKSAFTLDTDVPLVPASLITLGIIWRWRSFKGFDYAEAMSTYERELELKTSRDRGSKVLRPGKGRADPIADTGWAWPGTITQV